VPSALSTFTADQVTAYDAAWDACDDTLPPSWWKAPDVVTALTQSLAAELSVPVDDPDLASFMEWVVGWAADQGTSAGG
jgi:hypothetical protein